MVSSRPPRADLQSEASPWRPCPLIQGARKCAEISPLTMCRVCLENGQSTVHFGFCAQQYFAWVLMTGGSGVSMRPATAGSDPPRPCRRLTSPAYRKFCLASFTLSLRCREGRRRNVELNKGKRLRARSSKSSSRIARILKAAVTNAQFHLFEYIFPIREKGAFHLDQEALAYDRAIPTQSRWDESVSRVPPHWILGCANLSGRRGHRAHRSREGQNNRMCHLSGSASTPAARLRRDACP